MGAFGNGRGVGVTEALHGAADWPIVVLFALITRLGDGWLLFLLGSGLYVAGDELPRWGIDRRRGLFVLALALTYAGLNGSLKAFFDLPRPPGAATPLDPVWLPHSLQTLFEALTTADGPGFPSGHALGSTLVWGGAALAVDRGSRLQRLGVAGAIVLLVSLSRLVLGVHYLVDVVAGVGLGVLVLGALYRVADRGSAPGRVLLATVGVGVLGLLVGVTFESVAAVGGAVGAWLVWRGVADTTPAHPDTRREVVAGFAVFGLAGVLFVSLSRLEPPHVATFLGMAVAAGGAVAAPLLGERLA